MRKTERGIPYVEYNDMQYEFPDHMKACCEAIDALFDDMDKRIRKLEAAAERVRMYGAENTNDDAWRYTRISGV